MSKTSKSKESAPQFEFDTGLAIPPMSRGGGSSDFALKLDAVPEGASFLEAVTVAETITDPKEREQAFKDEAKKVANRVTGAIRRFKNGHPDKAFVTRVVNSAELGAGVRVWRVKPEAQPVRKSDVG